MTSIRIGQPWKDDPRDLLLRPYEETPGDLEALAHVRNRTLQATLLPEDFREATPEWIDSFYNRPPFKLVGNAWLLFLGEEPAGAAVVYPSAFFNDRPAGNFDMYVVPRLWGHGLGSRLLAHLEVAARERGYPVLETTVAAEDRQSTGFLREHGFNIVGQFSHLARHTMDDLPSPYLPEGYTIRSLAALGETPEFYRETINRLGAYDSGYSLTREEEMEHVAQGEGWEPEGALFLLDPDARIVGVIRASRREYGASESERQQAGEGSTQHSQVGYLNELRLEPASRGRGLGMALVAVALRSLANAGVGRTDLDTTGPHTPAHTLALKAGFMVTRHWMQFMKPLPHVNHAGSGEESETNE